MTNALLNSLANPVSKRQIISVDGLQGAKNFGLERGENVILMDSSDDIIYLKSIDDLGKCNLKVFRCTDITQEVISDNSYSIGKNDFDKLSKELADLKEMVKGIKNEYNVPKQQQSKKSDS